MTFVAWETFTDVSNEHTASTSKAEDDDSGFLQKPPYFDLNSHCKIWYTSTASTTTHQDSPIFGTNLGKVTRKGCKQDDITSHQKLLNCVQSRVYPKLINYYTNGQRRLFYYTAKTLMFQHPQPILAGRLSKLAY